MNRRWFLALVGFALGCGENTAPLTDAGQVDAPGRGADASSDASSSDGASTPGVLALGGDIAPVHDAVIIRSSSTYFLFATGDGIAAKTSQDLLNWRPAPPIFSAKPAWVTTTSLESPNHLWAPDVSFFAGGYHLYYSASTFGSNRSCIGHATSPTLEPAAWTDDGAGVICSGASDNFNAIDPAAIVDEAGNPWLAFGSFWSGIKLIPLESNGRRRGTEIYSLATRTNTAVEAPFLVRENGFYYLFESIDFCCQGASSTYRIMVGRAESITGPYVDRTGGALLAGGGTVVLEGSERWRGPGHNAVLRTPTQLFNVYHSYDANAGGTPTLRIAELSWSTDGWPVSAGP